MNPSRITFGPGFPPINDEPKKLHQIVRQHLAVADANEERRYLHEGRINIAWGLSRLSWTIGLGIDHDPYGEPFGIWLALGPLSIEAFVSRSDRP